MRRFLGGVAIVAIAAFVLVLKQHARAQGAPASAPARGGVGAPARAATSPAAKVVLFADLDEAGDRCGCGQIIRAVRAAEGRGVAAEEIDAESKATKIATLHLVVSPTVLILGSDGAVVQRLEGEDADTVRRVRAALGAILSPSR